MKSYTFNDADRLKEIVTQLQEWSAAARSKAGQETQDGQAAADQKKDEEMKDEGEKKPPSDDELAALLEELLELAELHPRNNLNVCLMGGMQEILSLIFSHSNQRVRKQACSILTAIVQNNHDV